MKFAVLTVIFVLLVVSTSTKRANNRCSSDKDCADNECCIARNILGFRKGDCRPLAKAGKKCSTEDEELFPAKYVKHCPCEPGLSCKPTEENDMGVFGKYKFNERCVAEPSTEEPDTEAPTVETEEPVEETEAPDTEIPFVETEEPVAQTEAQAEE